MTKAQVIALIDQYITTNGNQEITGAQTNSVMKALANQDIPFADITSKPTTLSGYGITNAYTKGQSDSRYVNVGGDTMTGALVAGNGITITGGHLNLNDFRRLNFGSSQDAYITYDGSGNRLNMILGSSLVDFRVLDGSNPIMTIDRLSNNTTFEQTIIGNNGFRAFGSLAPWFDAIVTNNSDSNIFRGRDSNNNTVGSITTRGFNGSGGGYLSLNGEWRINENSFWHSGNLRSNSQNDSRYALQSTVINAGVGLTGGGDLSANRTINFDTSWGDSRYAVMNDVTQNLGQLTIRTGNSNTTGLRLLNNSTGQSSFLYMDNSNDLNINNSNESSRPVYINKGGVGGLKVGGDVTANAFYESSDIRLKDNISPLNYGLNEILQLDTHTWNWKSDGSEDMGVIAQELELIMPELVKTDEDGYKSVNYTKLVPVLINAIKEISNG